MEAMEMEKITTIRCREHLKEELVKTEFGTKGQTYEQIIYALLDYYNNKNKK
jgi:hypothetical protein